MLTVRCLAMGFASAVSKFGAVIRSLLALFITAVVQRTGWRQILSNLAISKLPVPLEGGDINLYLWVFIQGGHAVLRLDGEEEQGHHDQDRDDGQHQLQRNVVPGLSGEFTLTILLGALCGVPKQRPQHKAPHDCANNPGSNPDPHPEIAHRGSLWGDAFRPAHAQKVTNWAAGCGDITASKREAASAEYACEGRVAHETTLVSLFHVCLPSCPHKLFLTSQRIAF